MSERSFLWHLLPRGGRRRLGLNAVKGWRRRFLTWLVEPELSHALDSMRGQLRQIIDQQSHVYMELQHLQRQIKSRGLGDILDGIEIADLERAVNGYPDVQERLALLEGRHRR